MPQILLPAMSPTMEEGTLAKWLVAVGDVVKPGDVIAEIETDKATMELEADDGGTVTALLVAGGSEGVKVGTPIINIAGEDEAETPAAAAAPKFTTEEPRPFRFPNGRRRAMTIPR
jgi:pyruvate dehydrogenase E1 component beta subunit